MGSSAAFVVEGVLLLIVGIIGICGNIAAIVVFGRRRRNQRNFHALMLSLAIIDLTYIIASLLLFSIPQFSEEYQNEAYMYILPWALPIAQSCLTGSIYFTMAITVERYMAVCHPFYRVTHAWPAKVFIIPITLFSVIYNIPKFFELETMIAHYTIDSNGTYIIFHNQTQMDAFNGTVETGVTVRPMALRLNKYYFTIYCTWMNLILMGLGPFLLLITLNVLILIQLMEMGKSSTPSPTRYSSAGGATNSIGENAVTNQHASSRSHGQRKEVVLAKVSLAIVVVFIICHSVKWIPNIYELLHVSNYILLLLLYKIITLGTRSIKNQFDSNPFCHEATSALNNIQNEVLKLTTKNLRKLPPRPEWFRRYI